MWTQEPEANTVEVEKKSHAMRHGFVGMERMHLCRGRLVGAIAGFRIIFS